MKFFTYEKIKYIINHAKNMVYIYVCVFCGFKTYDYDIFSLASLKETSDSTIVVDYFITIQMVYYNRDTM